MGLKYQIDSDGDFKLLFGLEDNRSQWIYINSNTERFHGLEIREVWSFAIDISGLPDPGLMLYLLKNNRELKFGSWRMSEKSGGGYFVIFAAQTSAESDADMLYAVMEMVMSVADGLEKMYGQDDN